MVGYNLNYRGQAGSDGSTSFACLAIHPGNEVSVKWTTSAETQGQEVNWDDPGSITIWQNRVPCIRYCQVHGSFSSDEGVISFAIGGKLICMGKS